jgi:transcriptional regulator with XRE-family HTH domain
MNCNTTTGEKLRKLRGDRSTKEIANSLGISESSYVKYERNERVPRDEIKKKIAIFYNSTVACIFFS